MKNNELQHEDNEAIIVHEVASSKKENNFTVRFEIKKDKSGGVFDLIESGNGNLWTGTFTLFDCKTDKKHNIQFDSYIAFNTYFEFKE